MTSPCVVSSAKIILSTPQATMVIHSIGTIRIVRFKAKIGILVGQLTSRRWMYRMMKPDSTKK